ncbi:hypothetical protein SGL43_03063 [Streptomyces globisporus]|uniref:Secreted protein n=1 Tax=Streptomyces globisporus TaxID=1908 RepID=A0ABM9GYY7_STRGL|nr:hypothetical protein DER30_3297 [Streptomyces sp. HB202]GGW17054.1 hypothetical protein GCM10010264_71180 [Streptomyces globisporus]CAH9416041.1 hypothetical protein SGL43_03063 [Streptomyces globisporus]
MRVVVLSAFLTWSGSAKLRPTSTCSCGGSVKPWMTRHLARTWHEIPEPVQTTKKPRPLAWGSFVERVTRIELAL